MEKAKRHPANPKISGCWRPILGLAFILLACTVIFGIFASVSSLHIYNRVSSVQDWDVPPDTEVIGFEMTDFGFFRWCDPGPCWHTGELYIASNLSLSDLNTYYSNHPNSSNYNYITLITTHDLYNDGRPIYRVWVEVRD